MPDTHREPPWDREEILLAAGLLAENGWLMLAHGDPRLDELSDLLLKTGIHTNVDQYPNFRSPKSVRRKTEDLRTASPSYPLKATKGGRLTREVAAQYEADPEGLLKEVAAVKASIRLCAELAHGTREATGLQVTWDDVPSATEGGLILRVHYQRERDPVLRRRKIEQLTRAGALACEVCGFDFERVYGEHGAGYIEIHHREPLAITGLTETKLADLAPLCANCHRMIHRRRHKWLTVGELASLVRP